MISLLVLIACFVCVAGHGWINEFHYRNHMEDKNLFMEIAGPQGEEAWEYLLVRYQGRDGTQFHDGISLSGQFFNLNPINGYGFIYYKFLALQGGNLRNGKKNGDALALVYNGQCIQFICYGEHDNETFAAATGPCINQTCMNIGVHEDRKQPVGLSLQLVGRGRYMENFTWHNETLPWTPGRVNEGQELMSEADYLQYMSEIESTGNQTA